MNSKQENTPAFSFGGKPHSKVVISSKHMGEVVGRDSPGAGAYDPNLYSISHKITKGAKFAVSKDRRFEEDRLREKKFKNNNQCCHLR